MKPRHAFASLTAAVVSAMSAGVTVTALAQTGAPRPAPPMVQPPPAPASGAASATNPDNMPVRKPDHATHDNMMLVPPASASKAK